MRRRYRVVAEILAVKKQGKLMEVPRSEYIITFEITLEYISHIVEYIMQLEITLEYIYIYI